MSNLIPFKDGLPVPEYLRNAAVNNDLTAHSSVAMVKLSIQGKNFARVRSGVRETIMSPLDKKAPAASIDVVIVKVNPHKSKAWYKGEFDPKAGENVAPDCSSSDGQKPDASIENPVNNLCATCDFNAFGSRKNGKGKECSDYIATVVCTPDNPDDVMRLSIPPTTFKALSEYGEDLTRRGVTYQAVVTQLSFANDVPSPQLKFEPVAFIDEATYKQVQKVAASDQVARMLGLIKPVTFAPKPEQTAKESAQALIENAKKVAETVSTDRAATLKDLDTAVKAGAKKAQPKSVDEIELDDLNFDD